MRTEPTKFEDTKLEDLLRLRSSVPADFNTARKTADTSRLGDH